MSAGALYRKYRSTSLNEVVGQEHVTDLLTRAFEQDKISHAYLLTGPRGVGKTSVARIIAHMANKLPYSEDQQLDIIEIDAASNRRIDDIRDLREKVHITPVTAPYKVYIIDEVHMLTGESFNALLKTLEEPPVHVIFILATTEIHKVPATIISRTQRFHFRPISRLKAVKHLKTIAKKEKITIDDDALELLAEHGGGSLRDSISLLDQLSSVADHVTRQTIESVLGMASHDRLDEIVKALETHDVPSLLTNLKQIDDEGVAPLTIADQLVKRLLEAADTDPRLYALIDALLDVAKAQQPTLKLTSVLVRYALPQTSKTVPSSSHTLARSVAQSLPKDLAKAVTAPLSPIPKPPVAAKTKPANVSSGKFEWQTVLETLKSHHPALYSVLSRAEVDFKENTLTLTFVYALHRKKLEQPQYRQQLAAVIHDVLGLSPEIVVVQHAHDNKKNIKDVNVQAVTAIMGGGEPIDA